MRAEPGHMILVVEDDPDSRMLLCSMLRRRGYNVIEAENGKYALLEASRNHPDLIIMDLAMPEMDGVEAVRRILQVPKLADIPIFAVTAYPTQEIEADVLSAGCKEVLEKPIDIEVLLQKIKHSLSPKLLPQTPVERQRGAEPLREVQRVQTSVPAKWGLTYECPHAGTITSLSVKGCLVETKLVVAFTGKPIFISFRLPGMDQILVQGKVLYYLRGVGFGMGFTQLRDDDKNMLALFVEHQLKDSTPGINQEHN